VHEHADELAGEGARHGRGRAGPFHHPHSLARGDGPALVERYRPEGADDRRDDHALRDEQAFTVVDERFHQTSSRRSTSSGVPTPRTGASGVVRLASPASIEPWPTSRNEPVPRVTMVAMDSRQR